MRTLMALATGLLTAATVIAAEPAMKTETHTYKTVDGLAVQLDVHRPAEAVGALPVLVWIHGGALINGSKANPPTDLLDLCRKERYALVSLDYRLAPEVKVPAIIEDIKDAFTWIRSEGPKKAHFDPARMVVTGGSAGGYLTMMVGVVVKPSPAALVAYWGYGDLDGAWYTQPSEHYLKDPRIDREDALKGLDGKTTTAPLDAAQAKARGVYYRYLRQNGIWTKEITGFDPVKDRAKIDPLCPVRNITRDYPPILMIHGEVDEDVPFQESADMDRELTRKYVPHEFIPIANGRHGLAGADKQVVAAAHVRAREFIKHHLQK